MPFKDVLHFRERDYTPPARVYVHHTAEDVRVRWFPENDDYVAAVHGAYRYFEKTIYHNKKFDLSKFAYIIGAVWANIPEGHPHSTGDISKMIDLFGFHDFDREAIDEQWRMQNPSVFSATLNGTEPVRIGWKWNGERQLFEPDGDTHCEDMNVILGKEAEHRRHTNNLAHYLSEAPDLGRKILEQR